MSRLLIAGLIAYGVSSAAAEPMVATPLCGERDDFAAQLHDEFQERLTNQGVVDHGAIIEVFVSESGSWTILATGTDDVACLIASGEGWQSIPPPANDVASVVH